MRKAAILMALVGPLCLILAGCAEETATSQRTVTQTTAAPTTQFVHAVFFDMKPDTPEATVDALIADIQTMLPKIPSVRSLKCGRRDVRMQREVSDTAFTVGLVITFDDKAGHDLYNDHPLHKECTGKYREHFAKVRVFDFIAPAHEATVMR